MISIYCDEDVDVLIKPLLEAKGFRVLTTQDENMLGSSDREQIDYAIKKGCVFLTHNRIHYEQLYSEFISKNTAHFGIILASRRSVYELARRISRVLSKHTRESTKGQLFYV